MVRGGQFFTTKLTITFFSRFLALTRDRDDDSALIRQVESTLKWKRAAELTRCVLTADILNVLHCFSYIYTFDLGVYRYLFAATLGQMFKLGSTFWVILKI